MTYAKNTLMSTIITLVVFQFIIALLFLPLRMRVKVHFSLQRENTVLLFSIFGIDVVHLRVRDKNGKFVTEINGKPKKNKSNSSDGSKYAIKMFDYIKTENIVILGHAFAYMGAVDAKNSALICAVTEIFIKPIFNSCIAYPDFENERLDFDATVKTKLNIYQIAEMLLRAISGE